jgi:hypothetical protein
MSAFQILTRDKQGGDDPEASEIVSYRLPTRPPFATTVGVRESNSPSPLPRVVLRLPVVVGSRRKLPRIGLAEIRAHASTVVLGLGLILALWLIFGGQHPSERVEADQAPTWVAPSPLPSTNTTESVAPNFSARPLPASGPRSDTPEAPSAMAPGIIEPGAADNQGPAASEPAPLDPPAPPDGTARAVPTEVHTATRPAGERWDGGNRMAPGEAAPLGIGTGAPQ